MWTTKKSDAGDVGIQLLHVYRYLFLINIKVRQHHNAKTPEMQISWDWHYQNEDYE